MNGIKKIIIIFWGVFLLLVVFNFIINKNPEDKVFEYLLNKGFSLDMGTLYIKQNSENSMEDYELDKSQGIDSNYELLYFNKDTYILTMDRTEYSEGIVKSFNPSYNYTNNYLTYNYRITINNTNVLIEGEYDKNNDTFSCNPVFSYDIEINSSIDDVCFKLEYDLKEFYYEAITLVDNAKILNLMK